MYIYIIWCVGQQNDYKEVMKRIETVLPKVIPSEYQAGSINRVYTAQKTLEPFARIGIVPTESSAYKAVNIYL